ncbi:MAG: hypothetical protein ACE5GO_04390, partial [Anaerolineales bacterium]
KPAPGTPVARPATPEPLTPPNVAPLIETTVTGPTNAAPLLTGDAPANRAVAPPQLTLYSQALPFVQWIRLCH